MAVVVVSGYGGKSVFVGVVLSAEPPACLPAYLQDLVGSSQPAQATRYRVCRRVGLSEPSLP